MAEIVFTEDERKRIEDLCSKYDPERSLLTHLREEHQWPQDFWELILRYSRRRIRSVVTLATALQAIRTEMEKQGWDDLYKFSEQILFSMSENAGRASDEDQVLYAAEQVPGGEEAWPILLENYRHAEYEALGLELWIHDTAYE